MKKLLALLLALVMTLALAACGGTTGTQGETPDGTGDAAQTEEKLSVALVVAGTVGDRSFYDSSKAGVDRLAADFEKDGGFTERLYRIRSEKRKQQGK